MVMGKVRLGLTTQEDSLGAGETWIGDSKDPMSICSTGNSDLWVIRKEL